MNNFYLYRFYYKNLIVYIGRTKQKLQNRIRGHLFTKPMHRAIDVSQVSKIEYCVLPTQADMFLYEIYFINKYKPILNVDDKANDNLTVTLEEPEWFEFNINTKLFNKWKNEIILNRDGLKGYRKLRNERAIQESNKKYLLSLENPSKEEKELLTRIIEQDDLIDDFNYHKEFNKNCLFILDDFDE